VSGLSPLVDTLLATRLAQRVDLVPLKPETQIAGPAPVLQAEGVTNDIRLLSRAAAEQQLGAGLLKAGQQGDDRPAAPPQPVTLSAAARAVSAILEGLGGSTPRIIGADPLIPPSGLPSAPVIAAALARAVGHSGLFYESHLAQFAAGVLPLAELMQEPQARLEGHLKAAPFAPDSAGNAASGASGDSDRPAGANSLASSAPAAKNNDESTANAPRGAAHALAGVHPDAVALVRQQLELLAQPAFRWSGEAWPAVPAEWEIQEDRREPGTGDNAAPPTWSTRLALMLPTLRDIEVRISLVGNALQVRMACSEDATCDRLREARAELPQRLSELGLELTGLQIGPLHGPAAAHMPKAGDGA